MEITKGLMQPMTTAPNGDTPILMYGCVANALYGAKERDQPQWVVVMCGIDGIWQVVAACHYEVWVENPLGWAPLPTVSQ